MIKLMPQPATITLIILTPMLIQFQTNQTPLQCIKVINSKDSFRRKWGIQCKLKIWDMVQIKIPHLIYNIIIINILYIPTKHRLYQHLVTLTAINKNQ